MIGARSTVSGLAIAGEVENGVEIEMARDVK